MKYIKSNFLSLITFLILFVGLSYALAVPPGSGPTQDPPGGNVDPPITNGNYPQTIKGGLTLNASSTAINGLIIQNGNVGIGTTTPGAKLHVSGGAIWSSGVGNGGKQSFYDLAGGAVSVESSLYSYGSICTGNALGSCLGGGGVVIGPVNSTAVVNITNSGTTFFNAGNVGIGTTDPGAFKLNVKGDSTSLYAIYASGGPNLSVGGVYGRGGTGGGGIGVYGKGGDSLNGSASGAGIRGLGGDGNASYGIHAAAGVYGLGGKGGNIGGSANSGPGVSGVGGGGWIPGYKQEGTVGISEAAAGVKGVGGFYSGSTSAYAGLGVEGLGYIGGSFTGVDIPSSLPLYGAPYPTPGSADIRIGSVNNVGGVNIKYVKGADIACPAGVPAPLMRKWVGVTGRCTTTGGWSVSPRSCSYNFYTASETKWTEAVCMGN